MEKPGSDPQSRRKLMIKRVAYLCGPTLKSFPHIGNYKTFYCSIKDFYHTRKKGTILLTNLTDISEQIYQKAWEKQITFLDLCNYYARSYIETLKRLHLKPWVLDIQRASFNIKLIKKDILQLLTNKNWDFYWSLQQGIRGIPLEQKAANFKWNLNLDETHDKNLGLKDFCLWRNHRKYEIFNLRLNNKDYKGMPGWHNECASLIKKYCQKTFTHYGGIDLKPLHHKNEYHLISSFNPYEITWKYTEPVLSSSGQKLSKSLGNVKIDNRLKDTEIKNWLKFFESVSMKARSVYQCKEEPLKLINEKLLKSKNRKLKPIKKAYFERNKFRKLKNYDKADLYRDYLLKKGYSVIDPKIKVL